MSEGFGKIYEQTYTGSMAGSGSDVFAVWGYVISHLRPPGLVELNPILLAAAIGTTREAIEAAIEYLCAPDEHSRTKDHDGRRLIQEGSFLYRAPTFEYYRNGKDAERRVQNAARQKAWRERQKPKKKPKIDWKKQPGHPGTDLISEHSPRLDPNNPLATEEPPL